MYDLNARYYDSNTARFLSEYPYRNISNMLYGKFTNTVQKRVYYPAVVQSGNRFAYCGNNPVMFTDPLGLVEVGLRAYAATYEGAVVDWDDETKTATVTYDGKKLPVTSTDENNRDGHIYVDDSMFVNAFGIGGKLIVYQDEVTKNVSIRASFSYNGEDAYLRIPGSESDIASFGVTYSSVFLEGIEEHWTGTFGEYNVSAYARYHGDGIKVSFKDEFGVSHMNPPLFGWSTNNVGSATMFTGDSRRPGVLYTVENYKWVAAHEFGHLLGVGDAYISEKSSQITSIYNVFGTEVQESDIEMVLKAWNNGKWQKW